MSDITVTYSGSTILTTDENGIKTLNTAGKYCLDNIAVQFSPSPPSSKINELISRTVSTYTNNNVTIISMYAFANCSDLTTASFPKCTTIGSRAFYNCVRLKSFYLTNSSVTTLTTSYAFYSTPIDGYSTTAGTFGSIYVPASLLANYKAATNWTYFSSRFVGI